MHRTSFRALLLLLLLSTPIACRQSPPKNSGAGEAMDYWSMLRSYPDRRIYSNKLYEAYAQWSSDLNLRDESEWEPMGPKNVGGRTLCLAFHPNEPETVYAGSASGGLWVSKTGGKGAQAWQRVRTGYPVMAVSAIAINPARPQEMFIGTGEVYNYQAARPGVDNRFNRGSYGMGILKSTDGGRNWQPSLDWRHTELRGIWRIIYNPLNCNSLLAATTEGIFRSRDSGRSWQQLSPRRMATDLEMHPLDTNVIYVSHGGYQSPERGIYRSTDGGTSFQQLTQIPHNYTGKAMISLAPSEPDWVYLSIADAEKGIGLFRSIDRGEHWSRLNVQDVPQWQGWYAHDIAIHPADANQLIYVGIDAWRSYTGGATLEQLSYWQLWQFGKTEVGVPEGGPEYVHADIHAAYYHPANSNRVFVATDGGIFESADGGTSWTSRNGGYQTQQFYADFSNSALDSNLAMGGLQDNSTVIYTGTAAWTRRIGGDGMTTAIDQTDDRYLYGSLQNLQMRRSTDRGENFVRINNLAPAEIRNFNSPFALTPSNQRQIYAGAQRLHVSTNSGLDWQPASDTRDGNNAILRIAVAPDEAGPIYLSTCSVTGSQAPAVFKISPDDPGEWRRMQGLPEQLCTDLVFHPENSEEVYALFGGFGTPHLFRTTDGGSSWVAIDNNLPDLPAHTLFIDPMKPEHLYLGNDMGVFFSGNAGQRWDWISQDIAEAVMVLDLSLSPANRKLRAATHGLGAFQIALDQEFDPSPRPEAAVLSFRAPYPNPTRDLVQLELDIQVENTLHFRLVDAPGRVLESFEATYAPGETPSVRFDLSLRAKGVYWIVMEDRLRGDRWAFRVIKV